MKYIARVTDCGPLSFRSDRDASSAETLDYIPGTALRAALADVHHRLVGDAAEFDAIFFGPGARFSNLYPAVFERSQLQADAVPVLPLPRTALSCKRFPGFQFDARPPRPQHGVRDGLIPWTLFALHGQRDAAPLADLRACPVCGEALDGFSGFARHDPYNAQQWGTAQVHFGLRTRTGIHRNTGTVRQEILYSRAVLRAGMRFWGTVEVDDDVAGAFAAFVQRANEKKLLRVGSSRSRGFGSISLALDREEQDPLLPSPPLAERVAAFQSALEQRSEPQEQLFVPVTLTADAIMPLGPARFATTLTPVLLGLPAGTLVYQNSATRRLHGWNNLWRVPRGDQLAIERGSVFVFSLPRPADDALLATLQQLERDGVGARRREGFGQIRVADPFHWEVNGL